MTSPDPLSVLRDLVALLDDMRPAEYFPEFQSSGLMQRAREVLAALDRAPAEVRTEWRVTGDAGSYYGPYSFVTDQPEKLAALMQASGFRINVKNIRVETRTVTTTPWVPVEQDGEVE